MARTKGAVNTSTMIKTIRDAGRYTAGLENEAREKIKAVYESVQRNAGIVPIPKGAPAPVVVKPTTIPQPVVAPAPIPPVIKPPTEAPSEFIKRLDAAKAAARARMVKGKATSLVQMVDPPYSRDSLVDTTLVEGHTVAEWDALIEERSAKNRPESNDFYVLDLSDIPGWATKAVNEWNAKGRPTVRGKALEEIQKLLDKAKENEFDASRDDEEARKADEDKEHKAAKKRREQAEKKRAKAADLKKRAEEIATLHSIKLS